MVTPQSEQVKNICPLAEFDYDPRMCGRFTRHRPWSEIHEIMGLIGPPPNLQPRYNIAPDQDAITVCTREGGRRIRKMRWGLIPHWAKDPAIGRKLINARAETAAEKPSFRHAFRERRCLVPADGFYEWSGRGRARQPWLIAAKDGGLLAFAGLWSRWRIPEGAMLPGSLAEYRPGDVVETFAILTTAANETVSPIHDRMPVIVPEGAFGPWLAGAAVALDPAPDDLLAAQRVSLHVNNPRNDDPGCLAPATAQLLL